MSQCLKRSVPPGSLGRRICSIGTRSLSENRSSSHGNAISAAVGALRIILAGVGDKLAHLLEPVEALECELLLGHRFVRKGFAGKRLR
jgi:hypothetical protein